MIQRLGDLPGLAEEVAALVRSAALCEFATLSAASVPIDTPVGCYWTDEGTLNVTTGLAYPSKAERARRNPKVGLLVEGFSEEPIVLITGRATVRDADIQGNVDRYVPEIAAYYETFSAGHRWEAMREAVHYWARVVIEVTPERIWWWRSRQDLDRQPSTWDAPPGLPFPGSDPPPAGAAPPAPHWPGDAWEVQADEVVAMALPACLSIAGPDGFPMPLPSRDVERSSDGFVLDPAAFPFAIPPGWASLCFAGRSTFVGTLEPGVARSLFRVERVLPSLPFTRDMAQVWSPSPDTKDKLERRLARELARRGQRMPTVPVTLPAPTAGSLLRETRNRRMMQDMGAGDAGAPFVGSTAP